MEKLTKDYEGNIVVDPVNHKLGAMPIHQLLFKMSFPMMVSMFMLACYNVVDSIFISRVSETALSALSLSAPIQFLVVALNIGTNVGVTASISRSLGEKRFERANDFAMHALFLAMIYSIFFAGVGFIFTKKYFTMQTNDPEIIKAGCDYLSIILIFSFAAFIETTFEKMMQATGKSVSSMITQLVGAILNIVWDPILIFGYFGFPAMGARGAAIATVGGQFVGLIVGYFLNKYTNTDLKLQLFKFKLKAEIIKNIFIIGFPSIVMQTIGSFMIFGLNIILIKYPSAVAVLGIYYKLQSFVFMPVFGLNSGLIPIVSYNFGSHNKTRIKKVSKYAIIIAIIIMFIGTIIVFTFPKFILSLFAANDNMIKTGVRAFKIISTHFCIAAPNIILSSIMQATKKEKYSLFASIVRQVLALLPSAYILSTFFGLDYVWFCFPLSEFIAFIIIIILYNKTYKEQIETL